jgi:hypothetical protein
MDGAGACRGGWELWGMGCGAGCGSVRGVGGAPRCPPHAESPPSACAAAPPPPPARWPCRPRGMRCSGVKPWCGAMVGSDGAEQWCGRGGPQPRLRPAAKRAAIPNTQQVHAVGWAAPTPVGPAQRECRGGPALSDPAHLSSAPACTRSTSPRLPSQVHHEPARPVAVAGGASRRGLEHVALLPPHEHATPAVHVAPGALRPLRHPVELGPVRVPAQVEGPLPARGHGVGPVLPPEPAAQLHEPFAPGAREPRPGPPGCRTWPARAPRPATPPARPPAARRAGRA